jgi:acyl dehydratase
VDVPMMPPVGSTARRSRKVSRRNIELFTELTGDRNPLHYDEQPATTASPWPSRRLRAAPRKRGLSSTMRHRSVMVQ